MQPLLTEEEFKSTQQVRVDLMSLNVSVPPGDESLCVHVCRL